MSETNDLSEIIALSLPGPVCHSRGSRRGLGFHWWESTQCCARFPFRSGGIHTHKHTLRGRPRVVRLTVALADIKLLLTSTVQFTCGGMPVPLFGRKLMTWGKHQIFPFTISSHHFGIILCDWCEYSRNH